MAHLLARFPELRALMTGREVVFEDLLKLGGDFIAAIIVAGTGAPVGIAIGNAADNLTLEEHADILTAIIELPMLWVLVPLVVRLSWLDLLAGVAPAPQAATLLPLSRN